MQDNFKYLHVENFPRPQKIMIYFIRKSDQNLVNLISLSYWSNQFEYVQLEQKNLGNQKILIKKKSKNLFKK